MSAECENPSFLRPITSLFGWQSNHFPVPTKVSAVAARSDGQGRQRRRRRALPLRFASPATGWRCVGTLVFVLLALGGRISSARAQDLSSGRDMMGSFVAEAAQRFSIPEAWIRAVMHAESAGQPRAVSPKGAMGLMQLMPTTWADMRSRLGLGGDPFDPHDNLIAGASYLRDLYDRFGASGFLAAYNAGPGRYLDYLARGRPLPVETRRYVADIMPSIGGPIAQDPQRSGRPAALQSSVFAALSATSPISPRAPSSLFAVSGEGEAAR